MEEVKQGQSADIVLKTQNLTKKFGAKIAVNNINMTIRRGDIYGFIGRNGAGKTTAMRVILGMANPTSGSVELFGGEPFSSARKKIGSLIEAPGLYAGYTAFENMKRFSILYGGTDEEINEILALVGLADTGKKKAGQFSLGMKQRLGLGIALLGSPEFLVLDEPVNGLDPGGIMDIRNIILKLNKEKGVTVLVSSHLLDELAKIVTRYGIINEGVLVEEVDADELNKRCVDGLRIVTSDPERTKEIIETEFGINDITVKGAAVILHNGGKYIDSAKINAALVGAGISVSSLFVQNTGLEDYFVARLGK
ncbi:MAG: ATP-binding cassette domain-containing protein [Clostridiales bacterium]|nr:ATP-binding cassette domain-containing protein [Clostridiales bacterium]